MKDSGQSAWSSIVPDIVEWDIPNWSVALDYWQEHSRLDLSSVYALEIGSRHGGLSLWLALCGARVVCTDIGGPSEIAVDKHAAYQVVGRIDYARLDALHIPHVEVFDVVLFKSVLGGIGRGNRKERQQRAVAEMYRALKPGGELWFAENLVASPFHQCLRRRWVQWGTQWRYVTLEEMTDFLGPFTEAKYTTVGFLGALGRGMQQRMVLGHLDRLGLDRLVPEHWRYIVVGVARK